MTWIHTQPHCVFESRTGFHLVLRLRVSGAVRPLPQYILMSWCIVKHRASHSFIHSFIHPFIHPELDNWDGNMRQSHILTGWNLLSFLILGTWNRGAGVAQWYSSGLRVWVPGGAGYFSPHHRIQTGSEAHPASYPMGTRDPFTGG
jgi:hypothetical protein